MARKIILPTVLLPVVGPFFFKIHTLKKIILQFQTLQAAGVSLASVLSLLKLV